MDIQSKNDWQMLWKILKTDCKKGEFPLVHFICHGSPKGLTVSGYRRLRWFDLIHRLRSITKFHSELFVTMDICYGADCKDVVMNLASKPFDGCICCTGELKLKSIERDKTRFRSFYNALINGETVDCAIEAFREELRNENVDVTPWVVGAYDNVTKCVKFSDLEKWIANSI